MSEPVIVIHGVATHQADAFNQTVEDLQQRFVNKYGGSWNFIPVFWGDLGGQKQDITDTIPVVSDTGVRSSEQTLNKEIIEVLLAGPPEPDSIREDPAELIVRGALSVSDQDTPTSVRGSSYEETLRLAVQTELPKTAVLQYVQDPKILNEVGRVIGTGTKNSPAEGASATDSPVRGSDDTRGSILDNIQGTTQSLLESIDKIVGLTVDDVLGKVNQGIRENIYAPFVDFFGDIFAYQHHPLEVQQRIWDALAANAPGYGTEQSPIHVIAHSLGGVVAFDAAVNAQHPLWIKSLVTFGSQAAFFEVLDPRSGLSRYIHGSPVKLPSTVSRWTNLWEPIDFLAFTAGTVFRLSSGEQPKDVAMNSSFTQIARVLGITHGLYWQSDDLLDWLNNAFNR